MAANCCGESRAQLQAFHETTVGQAEELHLTDTDDRGRATLFFLADRAGLFGRQTGDSGLAARGQDISHVFAAIGPLRHCCGCAVFDVIGMRHDDNRALPVLGEVFHRADLARQNREAGELSSLPDIAFTRK